jgi:hypothetical protein
MFYLCSSKYNTGKMTTIFANRQFFVKSACNTLIIRCLAPPANSLSIKQLRGKSWSFLEKLLIQYIPLCRAATALYKGGFLVASWQLLEYRIMKYK